MLSSDPHITERPGTVDEALAQVGAEFEAMNAKYYELRKDQQAVNDALKTEESLRQAVTAMETVAAEFDGAEREVRPRVGVRRDLPRTRRLGRRALLAAVCANREDQHGIRRADRPDPGAGCPDGRHRKLIEELLQRSISATRLTWRDLAEKVRPSDLVDIIEAATPSDWPTR